MRGEREGARSSEHPVDEPLRDDLVAAVKAGAVEPEAATGAVLDGVVVALRILGSLEPPFRRDALRPLRVDNLMPHAAPAELPRPRWRG